MAVSDLLPALIDRIVTKFAPEPIVLVGSQARGDARPDSDLDLLVVLGDESIDRRRAAIDAGVPVRRTHDLVYLGGMVPAGWSCRFEPTDLADLGRWAVEARYQRQAVQRPA